MLNLLILGAGGHAKEVLSYVRECSLDVRVVGLLDERKTAQTLDGMKILGGFDALGSVIKGFPDGSWAYLTAVGDNRVRKKFVRHMEQVGIGGPRAWTLCHSRATVGSEVEIGEGGCLAPGSILTAHVRLGRHCIVNVNASISHDCVVGDFANINPGAVVCGNATLGEGCYVGAGATIIDKVSVGEWTVVGAGAVVIEDLPPFSTAVGVPARVIERRRAVE